MADELNPAVELARKVRRGEVPASEASPSRLWRLAGAGSEYLHAMYEAGFIVRTSTGKPFEECPRCGWSP